MATRSLQLKSGPRLRRMLGGCWEAGWVGALGEWCRGPHLEPPASIQSHAPASPNVLHSWQPSIPAGLSSPIGKPSSCASGGSCPEQKRGLRAASLRGRVTVVPGAGLGTVRPCGNALRSNLAAAGSDQRRSAAKSATAPITSSTRIIEPRRQANGIGARV